VQLRFLTDGFGLAQSRRGYKSISPAQDPVDVPAQVQGNSGSLLLPDKHLSIGILGGIDLRKNPSVLVEAAAALENVVVVLAGRLSPEVRALASTNRSWLELRKAGRLVEINGLLTSEEFDGLLKQLTAVAILHDNDAPSGILCEAAARGTPAIVASGGWLEQIVATLQFGVATEISVEGVKETLESFGVREAEFKSNAAQAAHRFGTDAFVRALLN